MRTTFWFIDGHLLAVSSYGKRDKRVLQLLCYKDINPAHQSSLVAQTVKHLPAMRETWVWSLGGEDPLEKEMATYSSTLAWKTPWTEEPGRLQSLGSQRVRHDWVTSLPSWELHPHNLPSHFSRVSPSTTVILKVRISVYIHSLLSFTKRG